MKNYIYNMSLSSTSCTSEEDKRLNATALLLFLLFCMTVGIGTAQTSTIGNTNGSPAYLGWGANQNFPLNIEHRGARSIIFSDNNVENLRINPDGGVGFSTAYATGNNPRVGIGNEGFRGVSISDAFDPQTIDAFRTGASFFSDGSNFEDYSLEGFAADGNGLENAGVYGEANSASLNNVGVYARVCNPLQGIAGFFNGDLFVSGTLDGPSDESLKENVTPLDDSDADALMNILPRTYFYDQGIESMNLSDEAQYGLIAQEVAEVFPSIVHELEVPRRYDSEGELLTESFEFLSIDYLQFLALSVVSYQRQDAEIQNNLARLDSLENRFLTLAVLVDQAKNSDRSNAADQSEEISLILFPNPTGDNLSVSLNTSVEQDLVLSVSDLTGKVHIEKTLQSSKGEQTLRLNTDQLKSGFYNVEVFGVGISITKKFLKD